ncbi:MAG: T9SS type A sorting domain-containing protein, partial [Bacteroidota bacterium]
PPRPSVLQGDGDVCGNNSTLPYSTNPVSGAVAYTWEVTGPYRIVHPVTGNLVTSYTGPQTSVQVRFPSSGSASAQVRVSAVGGGPCGQTSASFNRTITFGPQTRPVNGPSSMAVTNTGTFNVQGTGLTSFSWSFPSGLSALSATTNSNLVVEATSATSGYVTATYRSCGVLRSSSKYVTVSGSSGGGPGFGGPARPALPSLADELPTISLYPNPATDMVTITAEHPLKQISVMNLVGQVIKTLDQVSGKTAEVAVNDLKAGTYYVITIDEEGSKYTQSLIVK